MSLAKSNVSHNTNPASTTSRLVGLMLIFWVACQQRRSLPSQVGITHIPNRIPKQPLHINLQRFVERSIRAVVALYTGGTVGHD
jgi:hypothetical protein